MNDRTLSPELARTAAQARIIRAKSEFSKSAVAVLRADHGAAEQASAALLELDAARAELAAIDAQACADTAKAGGAASLHGKEITR